MTAAESVSAAVSGSGKELFANTLKGNFSHERLDAYGVLVGVANGSN